MHGRRRRRSASSPMKSIVGFGRSSSLVGVPQKMNRLKGKAEATSTPEGKEPGKRQLYEGKDMNKGSIMDRLRRMRDFNKKQEDGNKEETSSRADIEQIVDEKLSGRSNNQANTLKTPKNDATTKELTTSSKDNAAQEAVTRLYKQ